MIDMAHGTFPRVFAPAQKTLARYDPRLDLPAQITNDLTFKKLKTFLDQADDGDAATMLQLWSEMLGKDVRLRSDVEKRTMALTRLDWDILPGNDMPDDQHSEADAQVAATFVKETLAGLPSFTTTLKLMAGAIPVNLAVMELIWSGNRLVEIRPVSSERLVIDYRIAPDIRIITSGSSRGIPIPPAKFIVHVPDDGRVNPFEATMARSIATLWLAKKLAFQDWATFSEIFGSPFRVGKLGPNPTTKDITTMTTALRTMGSQAWGVLNEGMNVEFVEPGSRTEHPAAAMIELIDRTITIGLLGGNLTSDTTGGTGTFSAIKTQDDVRRDIVRDDAKNEARTLESQLFEPMVRFRFPNRVTPIPVFQRVFHDPVDQAAASQALLTITRDLQLTVTKKAAYKALGMEAPERDANGNPIDLEAPVTPAVVAPALPGPFGA